MVSYIWIISCPQKRNWKSDSSKDLGISPGTHILFGSKFYPDDCRLHSKTDGIDGIIGPNTIEAVRRYQRSVGAVPDGYASLRLLERLFDRGGVDAPVGDQPLQRGLGQARHSFWRLIHFV